MESEMIERVAVAIFEEFKRQLNGRPVDVSADSDLTDVLTFNGVDLRATARAAIEAMREPTEAMVLAGADGPGNSDFATDLRASWPVMIDAALTTPPSTKP